MRPALVCGCTRYPSRSRATISDRTVAEETCTPGAVGHVGGADGLRAADVLGHHRLENGRLALVQGALRPRRGRRVGRACRWWSCVGLGTQVYRVPGRPSGTPATTPGRLRRRRRQSSSRRAEMKASWGTSTRPMFFMRFLPSFCFSSSLRLRVMSPP